MQSGSNGSLSSGGSYGSGYYGDPSATLLSGVAANASGTYADMLLQSNAVCYAPAYSTDESPGASCKQSYYHQEGVYGQPGSDCQNSPSTTRYQEAGGHHPGRIVQTSSSSSSSPSAAAAAAVAEATAALRLATSTSMFALKPPQAAGAFSLRGPTAEGFAVAARLAAGAAAVAADSVSTSTGLSSWYTQPSAVGFGGTTTSTTYGTAPSSFQLSGSSVDDGSTSLHSGIHGFHPAANGFLSPAGTSGGAYNAFQKLQTPWTTPRMTIDNYSSLDVCKYLMFTLFLLYNFQRAIRQISTMPKASIHNAPRDPSPGSNLR